MDIKVNITPNYITLNNQRIDLLFNMSNAGSRGHLSVDSIDNGDIGLSETAYPVFPERKFTITWEPI